MKIKNRNLRKINKKFERYNDSEISFVSFYYIRIILQKMPVGLIKDLRNPRGEYVCACYMNEYICVYRIGLRYVRCGCYVACVCRMYMCMYDNINNVIMRSSSGVFNRR